MNRLGYVSLFDLVVLLAVETMRVIVKWVRS
jgi:hypothetical protein